MTGFADLLRCPCQGDLVIDVASAQCLKCGKVYESKNGVLCFDPDSGGSPEDALKSAEQKVRDDQASKYDKLMKASPHNFFEQKNIEGRLAGRHYHNTVEVGCGTGRYTSRLANCADRVVAVDRSLMSLYLNQIKLKERGLLDKVLLIQADATQLPLAQGAFDFGFSAQVLEHLPSADHRKRMIESIARSLLKDAQLLMTVYEWSRLGFGWRKKEGFHRGGIYYFRFTKSDLEEVLAPHFKVKEWQSFLGQILLADSIRTDR